MAKLLITGANGQIGYSVSQKLKAERKYEILALSHEALDITNKNAVFSMVNSFRPDVIINAAAYTAVDKAESEQELAYAINVEGVRYLAEAANEVNAAILHISTDYVFDGKNVDKYIENDITHPLSIYGKTKTEGEKILLSLSPKAIVLRTSWAFGEHGNNFVKTILRLAKTHHTINVISDQVGGPTYVGDITLALLKITEYIVMGKDIEYGIYHFTGKPYVSWYDFAYTILSEAVSQNLLDKSPIVNAINSVDYPTVAIRPTNSRLALDKIYQAFGIQPSDWKKALKNIKNYME